MITRPNFSCQLSRSECGLWETKNNCFCCYIDTTPRTRCPMAIDSPLIPAARGESRKVITSATWVGVVSPKPPVATEVAGCSLTMPGLTVLIPIPLPACSSARCLAIVISAPLRTEPAMFPVTSAFWPETPDNPPGAGCPHMRQHCVGYAQEPQSLSLHRFHDMGRVGVPGRIQCPGAGCGGVHQAVDPSMHVHHLLDASLHRVLIACIQLQVRAGGTCGADGDRSLGPQAADHRGADQPGPADNQHNFSIKFQVHAV